MTIGKLGTVVFCGAVFVGAMSACGNAGDDTSAKAGKQVFDTYCKACHPDGGNIINPKKTLKGPDLEANGIKNAAGIVKLMRNPGPGMSKFDKGTISDKQAEEVAEYILKTF